MGRLLPFMAFFPSSYVVIKTTNDVIFGWYVSAFAAMYIGGKGSDALNKLALGKGRKDVVNRTKPDKE